jgi:hypothetical protein
MPVRTTPTTTDVLTRAGLLGFVAGLRSQLPLFLLSMAARRGDFAQGARRAPQLAALRCCPSVLRRPGPRRVRGRQAPRDAQPPQASTAGWAARYGDGSRCSGRPRRGQFRFGEWCSGSHRRWRRIGSRQPFPCAPATPVRVAGCRRRRRRGCRRTGPGVAACIEAAIVLLMYGNSRLVGVGDGTDQPAGGG